ncbi:orf3 [Panicum miliaceum]|uniref:Orf3 n=1 Tax=Panicum miliaceum TaxID=4540 RepID=A0A3L6SY60_PANMI|nr:orf3 [Panicum miliaceum]
MAGEVPAATAATAGASPASELVWSPSTMMDANIEALVAQSLLLEEEIFGWQSCTGEALPSEDRTKMVVFQSLYEKGFGLPSRAFFRGLLHYYGVEAMHFKPNSIAPIATFIHLGEGFLGIAPLIPVEGPDTQDVVGGATFSLLQGRKYPEATFQDSNKRWAEEWFVVANPAPGCPLHTGFPPVLNTRWEEKPTEEEMVEVEVLLAELQKLKAEKLTGATMALSFLKRLTQPIQERVHPGALRLCRRGSRARLLIRPSGSSIGSFSFDSSIGSESDIFVELSGPATGAGSTMKKQRATRKVATSKARRGRVAPRGWSLTPPGASRGEAEAAAEKTGLTTPKPEEEEQGGAARSPTWVAQSLSFAVPLKPSVSVRCTNRRVSLSGAKRKAEESTHEASSAEVAKGKVSPVERPLARPRPIEVVATKAKEEVMMAEPLQGVNIVPLEVTPGDGDTARDVEDPADPNPSKGGSVVNFRGGTIRGWRRQCGGSL